MSSGNLLRCFLTQGMQISPDNLQSIIFMTSYIEQHAACTKGFQDKICILYLDPQCSIGFYTTLRGLQRYHVHNPVHTWLFATLAFFPGASQFSLLIIWENMEQNTII